MHWKERFSWLSAILVCMWWLLIWSCGADDLSTGLVMDTGKEVSIRDDSGMGESQMYGATADWVSHAEGYGTGGAFADIDGDGLSDLVVAHGNDMGPGHLVVYQNTGSGLETVPSWRSTQAAYFGHLDVGDINNDGWPDVVVSRFLGDERFESPGGVQLYLNQGGVLEEIPAWEANGFFTFSVSLGDMDGDGLLDLAVAVGESYENEPDRARVFGNDGNDGFGESPIWLAPDDTYSFDAKWADFDGDGWLDLALAQQQTGHTIYRNRAGMLGDEPLWTADETDGPFEGNTLDVGDVNGDGHLDLVVSDNDQLGGAGLVRLWCGPAFDLCWSVPQAYASAVSLHDWDGDGDIDLAYGGWWSPVYIVENDGHRLSAEPIWQSAKDDIVVEALDWADVDGESGPELMVTDWTPGEGNRIWSR